MFLNTILLIVAIELTAGAILTIVNLPEVKNLISRITDRPNDLIAFYQGSSYYSEQQWSSVYWNEHKSALKKTYYPYVIWRSPSFNGRTLNIDQSGIRNTPGAECVSSAFKVFVFGGSSIWGWGSPDWSTIPAQLQSKLQAIHRGPVCVVNYGENAYVSTQSLMQLIVLLESGNVPDMVIFYDGVNEVLAASQSGKPVVHQNLLEISTLFQDPRSPLQTMVQNSSTIQLLQMILSQIGFSMDRENSLPEYEPDQLAGQIAEAYLHNYEIVNSLANTYNFNFYFFWQPHIIIGDKALTHEEQNMISGLNWVLNLDPPLVDLFTQTYENIETADPNYENLYYLGSVFDDVREPVWLDTWGHVTPEANSIVAGEMLRIIK